MEEQSVSDPDFDNITGLLYSSERRQHHYLRDSASPNKAKMKRPEVLRIVAAKMKVAVSTSLAPLKVDDSGAGERDRSEVMDVKKAGPSVPCCCPKHREVISTRRERLIERRRLTNGLELLVQLERLPTFAKGHVRTSTLITLMKRKLLEYFSNPPRAADATLPEQCVLAAQLSVREQKRVLYWRQRQELTRENFGGVLPVQFFHPLKFIDAFVDALEQLDRQRLDGSAFSRS